MRKTVSLLLSTVMMFSLAVPALATNDYSTGTNVVYEVEARESYLVTVPASMEPGETSNVTAEGTFPSNKTLHVTSDSTVALTNSLDSSDSKILNINFSGIELAGSNKALVESTESITVEDISNVIFGTWSGHFNYEVGFISSTSDPLYFGDYYVGYGDGFTTILVVQRDGSAVLTSSIGGDQNLPAGSLTFSENQIIFDGQIMATISVDKESITSQGLVLTRDVNFFESADTNLPVFNRVYRYVSDEMEDGTPTSYGNLVFFEDRSFCIYIENHKSSLAYGTGYLTYINNSVVMPDIGTLNIDSDGNLVWVDGEVIPPTDVVINNLNGYMVSQSDKVLVAVTEGLKQQTKLSIPSGVEIIRRGVFNDAIQLRSVDIPNTVKTIEDYAFSDCIDLVLEVPSSVTTIGEDAFRDVPHVIYGGTAEGSPWGAEIVCKPNECNHNITSNAIYTSDMQTLIDVSDNIQGTFTLPNTVTTIGDNAFKNCKDITSVEIESGLKSIGNNAFENCTSLKTLEVPNTLEHIGDRAFYNSGLTEFNMPNSVIELGSHAFYESGNLRSIILSSSLDTIKSSTFGFCNSLISLNVPEGIKIIEDIIFYGSSVESIILPVSLTTIYDFGMYNRLPDIYYRGTEEQWNNVNKNDLFRPGETTVHYNYTD